MANIDIVKAKANLQTFLQRVLEYSSGRLNDQRPRSTISVLGRSFVEGLGDLESRLTERFNGIVDRSVPRLFGLTTTEGVKTQIPLIFTPTRINTAENFEIAAGFRVTIGGVVFETDTMMRVLPGGINGTVTATALTPGSAGNVRANSVIDWQFVPGLLNIANGDPIRLGIDAKTIDNLADDVINVLTNRALIVANNYKFVAQSVLGNGAAVAVIPNLARDKTTFERGAMHIFGTVSGNVLTSDQQSALIAALGNGWATVYVSDVTITPLRVQAFIKVEDRVDNAIVESSVITMLENRYNPVNYPIGEDLDLYDLIAKLYDIPGVRQVGMVQFDYGNTGIFEGRDYQLEKYESVNLVESIVRFIT